ncbi:hypothetical protein Q4512_13665 [Oceanihabitans sp. 2_MG-2023]|uniref:hypothetical protein n=1 Tax=Oceanihabitans sp. 2_MG-2023 TaxID=3062661 RepID=UPI0026E16CA3|nr:hypothetical protein [Oceanihabitans sp. 2_MG-2023]MDO6597967.1 hypothetical protein [Oceanihabitans sp. 2_MG-2023]
MIKKVTYLVVLCFPFLLFSQTNAVTEYGDQVILMDDGTWSYLDEEANLIEEIPENNSIFEKDKNAKFLLKSSVFNIGIWMNTKQWKFSKASENEDAEYELALKGEDLYGTVITEKVEIPLKALREIAISNAKDVAPDTKITDQEYRTVNGVKVLMLKMSGTMSGIKFAYFGYYYSNDKGTVQIILFTSQNLMEEYNSKVETLLNGFVEL